MQAAVAALGYQPNLLARSLAKQQTQTLGMIVPDIANPFFPEVVRGAEDVAHAAGYTLLIASSDNDLREGRGLPAPVPRQARGRRHPHQGARAHAAGARSARSRRPACRSCCSRARFRASSPTSSSSTTGAPPTKASPTCSASATGASAFIGGLHGASTSRKRLDGYKAALRDAKIPLDPALVAEGDFRVESGYRAGLELLKSRPDAVFIANYLMTVGFMEALRQYRLRCPEDVALVTCDDYPWMDSFSPRLTTIDLPKRELGAAAAQLLVERHREEQAAARAPSC